MADKRRVLVIVTRSHVTVSEARALDHLKAMTGRDDPLAFICRVLEARPADDAQGVEPQIWNIKSASSDGIHRVDISLRVCTCSAFHFRHRCEHLPVADFAAQLRYQLTATSEKQS